MAAQDKVTFKQDLTEPVKIRHYEGVVFTGDDCGNLIKVALFDGGVPYSGGGTVSATAVLADGTTFPLTHGSITGNMVSVPLEAGALVVSGLMGLYVKISGDGIICTVLNAIFTVQATDTGMVPAAMVTTVNELMAAIRDAQDSFPADLTNLLAAVAPTFNTSTAYSAGAYVWQGGKLYRFTAAHQAGTWTGTDAVAVALGNDVADLKSALASYEDAVVLVKNLAGELTLGKFANSDTSAAGGNIRFYDSDTRGYVKIKVKPNTKYAINLNATDGFSANFSWWAYESSWANGTAISKVSIDSNCITTSPANANLLYLTANNPASANVYVVLEQETSIHGATVEEYPFNEPKAVVINDLQLDASKYELHNVDISCIYDSVLSFEWDSTNNYMTISTDREGNLLFVLTSNLGSKILTYSDLGAKSWNVPHGNALIYLFNRTQFVTKTDQEINALTEPYVVLAYLSSNGSGGNLQISGIWEKYWIKQGLSQRIDSVNTEIASILDDLPAYYYTNDYFPNKLQSVRDNMNFQNGICFAFITDTHFNQNQLQSKKMLSQLMKKTQVPFVVFGGDAPRLIGDMDGLNADIATLQTYADAVGRENWYAVRGNHDFYDRTDAPVETRVYYSKSEGQVYNTLMKSFEGRMTNGDPEHMCYYIDIPAQKTRIIVLNTTDPQTSPVLGGGDVSEEQAAWLVSAINSVTNTNIIVITHIPTDLTLAGAEATNVKYIRWVLSAFANGTDVQSEIGGAQYTFTGTTNKMICAISGHNHKDQRGYNSGYLNIVTTCDALYLDDGHEAEAGTVKEQAFDVYFIDYDNETVKTVRFGRGDDRAWNYSDGTVIE